MEPESWPAPSMTPSAAADQACQPAPVADLKALGLPEELPPDWRQRLLGAFAQALEGQRGLRQALEACVGCGACHGACPFYMGTGDPLNTPQGRASLARRVYQRHFSPRARLLGQWRHPKDILDESLLGLWRSYFWQCTLCRRCALLCPLGIDTSLVTRACRHLLAELGQAPGHATGEVLGILASGNGQEVSPAAWTARHQALEEELWRETGLAMACPVDEQGADVLLVPSPQEPFSQAATYKGYAKVFHAAGLSWTTSTYLNQASNPGLWLGPRQAAQVGRRLLEAARLLKPRHIVIAESGQGWAVWRGPGAILAGGLAGEKYLKIKEPLHICQLSSRLLQEGAFAGTLRPQALQGVKPVFHEPCQVARSGGLGQAPRRLLKAACLGWLEMPRPLSGPLTLCCGAGGGLNAPELYQARLAGLLPLARALAQAQRRQGCTAVVTMCATCQDQLGEGLAHFGLGLTVHGLHELLGQALYPSRPAEARP